MKSIKESLLDALNESRDRFMARPASALNLIKDLPTMYKPGDGWKLDDIFDKKDGIRKVRTILSKAQTNNKDFIRTWDEIQKHVAKDDFLGGTMRKGVGGPIKLIGKAESKNGIDALLNILLTYAEGKPKYANGVLLDCSTVWLPADQMINAFKGRLTDAASEYVPSEDILKKSSYFKMHVAPSGITYTCVPKDLTPELEDVVFKTYAQLTDLADPR